MRFRSKPFVVSLSLVLALSFPAIAADTVGKITGGGNSIMWSGHGDWESVSLTVLAPDGSSYQRTFKNGNPSFSLRDLPLVEDGQYNFELSVEPKIPASVRAALNTARARGDQAEVLRLQKQHGLTQRVTQSGTFTILNGQIVNPDGVEPDANDSAAQGSVSGDATATSTGEPRSGRPGKIGVNDQVIPDDLIVQSSTCTGFDCVDGESFGFDTLRLKENNLRIHFDDTSTSAGYPANDWRIIANDSASGGANKFVVEDSTAARNPFTIEAASPANSLYVDSTGNIGFQQSAPGLDLHLTTTDTPAFRMEQTNGGGFTAQTWDIGANEANFFVRDLTGGSRLSFRIRPGAPTSSIDIAASGNVGVGTGSPESKLHVFGTSTVDTIVGIGEDPDGSTGTTSAFNVGLGGASFGRGAGFVNVRPDSGAVAPNPSVRFMTANTVRMIIDNEGFVGLGTTANPDAPIHYTNGASQARLTAAGVWQDASSREAKENISELDAESAYAALEGLQPVTYNYKVEPADGKVGFIAEDVPEIVATPERSGLSALDIVAVVTKVVQEQQKTISELNRRIAELEKAKNEQ